MAQVGPIWYPDNTTNYNINTILSSMATSINDAYGPYTEDSGWLNCIYSSGYVAGTAGQLAMRRIGKIVYVRGGAQGTFGAGAYVTVAEVPAGLAAPAVTTRDGAFGNEGKSAGIEIGANRLIKMSQNNPVAATWIGASTFYLPA